MNRKLLILTVGLLIASFAQAQVATISASQTSGCLGASGFQVVFNGASAGATSWSWTFGDGGTSTSSSPNHTYFNAGTYTVTLTINGGSTTTATIKVLAPPTVKFTVSDSTGCFPLNVTFKDQSTSPSGAALVGWRWDFGDGDTSNVEFPSHRYDLANPPGFPVVLEVVDANGCSNTLTKSGYIVIPTGVTPSFQTIASQGCKIPITVNLNNTTTGPPTISYIWSFGDGSANSTNISPSHTFVASGNYNIKLVASSTAGCSDSTTVSTPILAGNVTSNFSGPDSVCVNTLATFVNTSAPTPTISNWTFGDGTSSTVISPVTKTYTTPNVYTVKLTNTFGACIDSISKQITVLTPATADFTGTNLVTCDSVFTVNFTDQSTNASSWLWVFGDGQVSNLQNPTHTYSGYGSYSVTLQTGNAAGCNGNITKTNFVQSRKPYVHLSNSNAEGCAPFSYTPILIDTVIDGISTYSWDFGNGTTSTSASPPAQSYPNTGTYYVKLTVTTNAGCTATAMDTIQVGTIKPVAKFTVSPTTVCVNAPLTFTDQSTNSPNQWLWIFGDGGSSTSQNPVYNFRAPGTFIVTLKAYNNGCNDSAKQTVIVNPPLAKYSYSFSCQGNTTVFAFHDSSVGANTWAWDFGDGTNSNVQSPVHMYPNADATYTATETVTNSTTGCVNTFSEPVYIVKDTAVYVSSSNNICINNAVTISVYKVNLSHIYSYTIDYGDSTVQTTYGPSNAHVYTKTGNFQVKVILTLISGCLDTLPVDPTVNIHVAGPTANFSTSGTNVGCTGLNATFTDLSKTDGIDAIKQWIWNFGDSSPTQTYTSPPFTHNYTKQGIYTVTLKVIDASGCFDSTSQINLITVAFPSAIIGALDSLSCPGSPIQFINNSKGYGLTYTWNFGDGSGSDTSNLVNPSHIYAIGNYNVSLKVVDQYGCGAVANNYNVTVNVPTASFTLNDTFASCPPLTANFTFTGSYYKSLSWSFGDGGISDNVNPTHFYSIPGTYTAGLVVTSHGGCTATAPTRTIKILGPYGSLTYTPLQGCHILPVNFSLATGNNVVKYLWLFSNSQADSTTVPSISFTYDSVGKYIPIVVLEDSTGCSVPVIGTDTILVTGSYPKFGYSNGIFCDSGTVQFSDSSATFGTVSGYQWYFGDGGTSNQESPSHLYTTPGLYSVKLVITMQTNCQDSVIMTNIIKVSANPSIAITGDTVKCVPASMTFQGVILQPDPGGFKWFWNFGNGNTDSVQNPAAQTYPNVGIDTVKLTATNSSGCSTTVSQVIQIDSIALTNAGNDTAICVGQSASLNASSTASPATFTWLPPTNGSLSCTTCNNPIATPITTTIYYVQGANSLGCGTTDSVIVTVVQPASLSLSPLLDSICLGQKVQLNASGEKVYSWFPASGLSNPTAANPFASPDSTTIYEVIGSDSLFCFKDSASVQVTVFNYPTLNIGPRSVTIPIGTTYQINGIGSADIDSINWSPTIGLSCANCLTPIASPVTTTTYVVSVDNNGGCITTDSVKIIVTCDGKNLFVPNTFSPNGDGHNDWFYVQGTGLTTIQSMQVFNRWGQLVFEKKNFAPNVEQDGWDGNFNGNKAPVDVYIYTIEVICENSQIVAYHGNVALIR